MFTTSEPVLGKPGDRNKSLHIRESIFYGCHPHPSGRQIQDRKKWITGDIEQIQIHIYHADFLQGCKICPFIREESICQKLKLSDDRVLAFAEIPCSKKNCKDDIHS